MLDRREFLTTAATLAVGAWIADASAAETDAKARPLRIAVMGLGGRGNDLAPRFAAQPGVTLAALCEPDATRLAAAVGRIERLTGTAPQALPDFRTALDDPAIDLLVVAAPNHWHGPATVLACAAGKHVYVEKPACHNPAEGQLMIAAAAKHHRCVQVGTQRRSAPAIREGIDLVHSGAIGEPYYARCWYANARGSIGHAEPAAPPAGLDFDLWQGPAPRVPFRSNILPYSWHWFWHWGNGELGNNGPHALDLARWALGVEFPTAAVSSGGRYAFDDDQETPDTHVVGFRFPGGKQIAWEGLSCNRHGIDGAGFGVTVHGPGGTLAFTSGGYTLFDDRDKQVRTQTGSGAGDEPHIANFLEAVRAGDPSLLNCGIETGHRSTLPAHLGNIAHRVGRALACSPEDGRPQDDPAAAALWHRDYAPGWQPTV